MLVGATLTADMLVQTVLVSTVACIEMFARLGMVRSRAALLRLADHLHRRFARLGLPRAKLRRRLRYRSVVVDELAGIADLGIDQHARHFELSLPKLRGDVWVIDHGSPYGIPWTR